MEALLQTLTAAGQDFLGPWWPLVWTLVKIGLIVAPIMTVMAYLTLAERKVIGFMQLRCGPNRVGIWGLLQPVADGLRLMVKELLVPRNANKFLFILGPVLAVTAAMAAWVAVPFTSFLVLANLDASLLYVLAMTSAGVYGIILSGWASNSKYALLGALRSAAQMLSYEVAMGLSLICVLMVSGSLNLVKIVEAQANGQMAALGLNFLSWNWLPLLPMMLVYFVAGLAETNRAPFDVAEGESEIVAGFHVEYSGMGFALFFMAEYTNMILLSTLTALLFLGGWLSPVRFLPDGIFWLLFKVSALLFLFLWFRATFPRYRYDQIMRLGWKVFLPLSLFWLLVVGVWMM